MTGPEFVDVLLHEFPELEEDVRDNDGLLHMQMGDFAGLMQRAINERDLPRLKRCVHLAQRVWQTGEAHLRNALSVSCLEHLAFRGTTGQEAFALLTRELREEWEKLDRFQASLATPPRKRR
ncbi:DUF7674 family protein [Longimicrobium terrae]|uniref:DUF7674 domain-containing protein n=1 Tax=Longimicrobium terrae TaxID=1639882 RepID=A0A841GZG2_9BACT|nr:hypothetical protein [Longimicrobium terrae]MBB4636857.1 hypothetical protein [Longimicrobium terrae]MBB6071143.1 hypothetical protein [Longimicrobium terrae]NNC29192.1 hypothetical protein [Longimicrobium terrae]